MAKRTKVKEQWKTEPDPHDYPAASNYLSLLLGADDVHRLVSALEAAPIVKHQAKDLLRASALPLLAKSDVHVAIDLEKVAAGDQLSPVLIVRGDLTLERALTVADGYHRICASYHLNEDADIPCRLVALNEAAPTSHS